MLRRTAEAECEFVLLSLWESMQHVEAFAGDPVDQALFHPEDDHFLIDRDLRVRHYEVAEAAGDVDRRRR